MNMSREVNMGELVGLTFVSATVCPTDRDEVHFHTDNGDLYKMFHQDDCCENVELIDVCGDIQDLVGSPILSALESVSGVREDAEQGIIPPEEFVMHKLSSFVNENDEYYQESETWTFYLISTIKGSVTLRWHGSSNGYYSESVDIIKMWVEPTLN